MGTAAIHRVGAEEVAGVLAQLAAGGGTVRSMETWQQDHMTALQLGGKEERGEGGGGGAIMPLSVRAVAVAPGRRARVGWVSSNQMAQRMGARRQSRGTVGSWAELLPELDALVVVRRDQPSLVGRWYAQTGFYEVLSIRCLYLEMEEPPAGPVGRYVMRVVGAEDGEGIAAWGGQMMEVHGEVFGNYGGMRVRDAGFWGAGLRHHFYQKHYQFQVIGLWSGEGSGGGKAADGKGGGLLMGYAVVGWSGWHSKRPRMDILELATRQWDTGVAEELIRTTCQLAWSKNVREVRAVVGVHDPYRSYLTKTGFEDRWGYVMEAKWLHAQRYLDSLTGTEALGDVAVQINTPGQVSLTLGNNGRTRGQGNGRLMRVQGDEGAVTRLLFQRLDVSAAVREGQLLVMDGEEGGEGGGDVVRLAMAMGWTPWVFHMVDFI